MKTGKVALIQNLYVSPTYQRVPEMRTLEIEENFIKDFEINYDYKYKIRAVLEAEVMGNNVIIIEEAKLKICREVYGEVISQLQELKYDLAVLGRYQLIEKVDKIIESMTP